MKYGVRDLENGPTGMRIGVSGTECGVSTQILAAYNVSVLKGGQEVGVAVKMHCSAVLPQGTQLM